MVTILNGKKRNPILNQSVRIPIPPDLPVAPLELPNQNDSAADVGVKFQTTKGSFLLET
jgi:hypothetical protein